MLFENCAQAGLKNLYSSTLKGLYQTCAMLLVLMKPLFECNYCYL